MANWTNPRVETAPSDGVMEMVHKSFQLLLVLCCICCCKGAPCDQVRVASAHLRAPAVAQSFTYIVARFNHDLPGDANGANGANYTQLYLVMLKNNT